MATYDDEQGKPRFVDGEGLTFADLNNLGTKMERKFWEQCHLGGMEAGNVANFSLIGSSGIDPYLLGEGLIDSNIAYCPFPLNGPIEISSLVRAAGNQAVSDGILGQRWKAGLTGTDPTGISQKVIHRLMATDEYDIGAQIVANTAPGAGNPRWDTVGMLLGFDTGASETRDFEDAVTRAKSSSSIDKEHLIDVSWEFVTGSQSATYDMATLSANYVPILTIARPAAEATPLDIDNFYYNAYPMRIGIEDIPGYELHIVGTQTQWNIDDQGYGSIEKNVAGSGTLLAIPRTMHAGCRLVGFGICGDGWNMSPYVYVGELDYDAATGLPAFTSIVDISDNGITNGIDGGTSGFQGVGEADWSPTNKPLPIWGNGLTAGPLFAPERQSYSSPSAFSKLAVKIQNTGTNWSADDRILFVRFLYLY